MSGDLAARLRQRGEQLAAALTVRAQQRWRGVTALDLRRRQGTRTSLPDADSLWPKE
jgi:hypothetical protein